MQNNTTLVVFVTLFCYSIQLHLPPNFKKCKRSGDDFNGCLKAAIQDALPKCDNGIPHVGIPKLQPLYLPEVTIGGGATGTIRLVQHYTDVNIYNLTRTKVDKIECVITETDFKLTIDGVISEFVWNSDYDVNGNILVLPISGNGKCYGVANNAKVTVSFIGEIYEKRKENYIKINTVKMEFNPEGFTVHLTNLFNGDERLGEGMNNLLNSNWEELWADTKPNSENLFQTIFIDYVNRLFRKIPMNNIFPL